MVEWLVAIAVVTIVCVSYILAFVLHNNWKLTQFKNRLFEDIQNSIRPPKPPSEPPKPITPKVKLSKYRDVINRSRSNDTAKIDLDEYQEFIEKSKDSSDPETKN